MNTICSKIHTYTKNLTSFFKKRPSSSGKPTAYLGGRTSSIISNTSAGSLNDDFSDDDYEEDDDFDGKTHKSYV